MKDDFVIEEILSFKDKTGDDKYHECSFLNFSPMKSILLRVNVL